jgi:hypothetical protein
MECSFWLFRSRYGTRYTAGYIRTAWWRRYVRMEYFDAMYVTYQPLHTKTAARTSVEFYCSHNSVGLYLYLIPRLIKFVRSCVVANVHKNCIFQYSVHYVPKGTYLNRRENPCRKLLYPPLRSRPPTYFMQWLINFESCCTEGTGR